MFPTVLILERRVEVKYDKDGIPYINLTNEDLRLLGISKS